LNKEIDAHFVLIDDHFVFKSSLDRQIIKELDGISTSGTG